MYNVFKTRPNIIRHSDPIYNFYTDNLIVSGCSFTHNHKDDIISAWPYYLRDFGGFKEVLDCSIPGAGNNHISDALIWGLEIDQPPPENSLVIVMWSGNDRDDLICSSSNIRQNTCAKFYYTDDVMSGISGGSHKSAKTNTDKNDTFNDVKRVKNYRSRAIENYLIITKTWNYLTNKGYKFVFLQFMSDALPSRTLHFDIKKFLPLTAQIQYEKMMTQIINPYEWAFANDQLSLDLYHPNPRSNETWAKEILLPKLQKMFKFDPQNKLIPVKDYLLQKIEASKRII